MMGLRLTLTKNLAQEAKRMYRKRNCEQVSVDDFIPPFDGELSADNRWVKLSRVIPWDKAEERYAARFGKYGNIIIPLRAVLGALIIGRYVDYRTKKQSKTLARTTTCSISWSTRSFAEVSLLRFF